jgi:hypothetical protein
MSRSEGPAQLLLDCGEARALPRRSLGGARKLKTIPRQNNGVHLQSILLIDVHLLFRYIFHINLKVLSSSYAQISSLWFKVITKL